METTSAEQEWTSVIRPVSGWFDLCLGDLWRYRDLVMLFVWRDFVTIYKQTILGPLWYLLQPLLTTLVFTVIFSKVARMPTDGLPPFLFYLSGVVGWRYFADCLVKTSNCFVGNAGIFGKVYFPRLCVPLSIAISNLISFCIQFLLFLGFWVYFFLHGGGGTVHWSAVLLPLLILQMAALGLGCGIIVSSLTTKYRDLAQLVGFGVQLWMFVTPVVYPSSIVPVRWQWLIALNPMAPIVETFRYIFFGVGTISLNSLVIGLLITVMILVIGVILFSRIEKTFMDTV